VLYSEDLAIVQCTRGFSLSDQ